MTLSKEAARQLLRDHNLRATAPRLAVVQLLANQVHPLSHTEVLHLLGDTDWDQATVYRNLVKLTEAGLTRVVSRAEGMARYEFNSNHSTEALHNHPHFVCTDCGIVSCLPTNVSTMIPTDSRWSSSIRQASVQFQGTCPDCM